MQAVLGLIFERIRSERLAISADIAKIMIVIIGMAHFFACIWYGIGSQGNPGEDNEDPNTWVVAHEINYRSIGYKYFTCLHWALSQFQGGMDEVRPHNLSERIYAICVLVFAFLMVTAFVSRLTSSMTQLHILASRKSQQFSVLRSFLTQHHISTRLALRIQRNAARAIQELDRSIPEENVELLTIISESLRMYLHYEVFAPMLTQHAFFAQYAEECPHIMRKVCHEATSTVDFSVGDLIFNPGETPAHPKMRLVCTGRLQYISISGHVAILEPGTCIAEAALWTSWMHCGRLTATTHGRLCVLDAKKFQDIVGQFDHPDFDPRVYATEFLRVLNTLSKDEVSDLPFESAELDEEAGRPNINSGLSTNVVMTILRGPQSALQTAVGAFHSNRHQQSPLFAVVQPQRCSMQDGS